MYNQISEDEKRRFVAEVLTIQEVHQLMTFRDNEEKFQEEFMRLWEQYQEKNFQSSFSE